MSARSFARRRLTASRGVPPHRDREKPVPALPATMALGAKRLADVLVCWRIRPGCRTDCQAHPVHLYAAVLAMRPLGGDVLRTERADAVLSFWSCLMPYGLHGPFIPCTSAS